MNVGPLDAGTAIADAVRATGTVADACAAVQQGRTWTCWLPERRTHREFEGPRGAGRDEESAGEFAKLVGADERQPFALRVSTEAATGSEGDRGRRIRVRFCRRLGSGRRGQRGYRIRVRGRPRQVEAGSDVIDCTLAFPENERVQTCQPWLLQQLGNREVGVDCGLGPVSGR